MSDDLKNVHYDPEIGFAYDPTTGRLWRVRLAKFNSVAEANEFAILARKEFFGDFVRKEIV